MTLANVRQDFADELIFGGDEQDTSMVSAAALQRSSVVVKKRSERLKSLFGAKKADMDASDPSSHFDDLAMPPAEVEGPLLSEADDGKSTEKFGINGNEAHMHVHARTRTHTRTHARTRARTHARTHTHARTQEVSSEAEKFNINGIGIEDPQKAPRRSIGMVCGELSVLEQGVRRREQELHRLAAMREHEQYKGGVSTAPSWGSLLARSLTDFGKAPENSVCYTCVKSCFRPASDMH